MKSFITIDKFQKTLLNWFDQHGRKNLPWQHNKTPYRVWVSEIMLQQTQVSTVIPYFERFMQHFPDLETLAAAEEDQVLHLWAGLGYYSRARNLHRAAQMVMTEFAGRFPDDIAALKTLPGIGESTAGAIMSLAFDQPSPILDGNVKRVFTRLHGIKESIADKKTENLLWEMANRYIPTERAGDYTQAIMDLGATLCMRGKPQCAQCPFAKQCIAKREDIAEMLPVNKKTRALPTRVATFVILKAGKHIYLQKRPSRGIWGGLWSFPEIAGLPDTKTIRQFCRTEFAISLPKKTLLPSFRHTFTHFHLELHPVVITLTKRTHLVETSQIWYNLSVPEAYGLPKPIQSIIREL